MALRNFVFRIGNQLQNLAARRSLAYLNQIDAQEASSQAALQQKENVLQNQRELLNVANVARNTISEEDRPEFDILKKFYFQGANDAYVNPRDVLLQIDRIQVLKNLKLVEENQGDIDPELVRVERLKARVLLEEPGAVEEYAAYTANRPYNKSYEKWGTNEEQLKQQILA